MKRWRHKGVWLCGCFMVCSLSSLAADPVPIARSPAVDLAIEWVPHQRPPVQSLGRGAVSHSVSDVTRSESVTPGANHQTWSLRIDDRRLSMALQRWSVLAGWQLVWEAERDFPIDAGIELEGSWASVLEQVMKSLQDSDYPLQAVMNVQTRVLRVRRQLETLQ